MHYQQLRWSADRDPHVVELAVHLQMESGLRFRIGWGDEFSLHHGNGVTVSQVRCIDRDAGPLDRVDTWPAAPIRAAAIRWQSIEDAVRHGLLGMVLLGGDHLRRADYPHALQLDFEDDAQVSITCAFTNHLRVDLLRR